MICQSHPLLVFKGKPYISRVGLSVVPIVHESVRRESCLRVKSSPSTKTVDPDIPAYRFCDNQIQYDGGERQRTRKKANLAILNLPCFEALHERRIQSSDLRVVQKFSGTLRIPQRSNAKTASNAPTPHFPTLTSTKHGPRRSTDSA